MIDMLSSRTAPGAASPVPGTASGMASADPEVTAILPRQPKTVSDTGLEPRLVCALVLKTLHATGRAPLPLLAGKLRLSISVLREVLNGLGNEQQVEVAWSGDSDIDVQYQLTAIGQRAALASLAECRYIGPTPVTLGAYRTMVERQSLRQPQAPCDAGRTGRGAGRRLPRRGAARTAGGRPPCAASLTAAWSYRFGQDHTCAQARTPVTGRRCAALRHPGRRQDRTDARPPAAPGAAADRAPAGRTAQLRCALGNLPASAGACRRRARSGMLALRQDPDSGTCHAPAQLQANNGIFVIDDLGRQRRPMAEMLAGWLSALDGAPMRLGFGGSSGDTVPFDAMLVFATNLAPASVFDPAFLRRIGYRIGLGPLAEPAYRAVLRRACRLRGIDCDEVVLDHLVMRLHRASGTPLLACYPHELLGRVLDFAGFAGTEPRLTIAALEQAWNSISPSGSAPASCHVAGIEP
ncbi:ATP-binding protein [Massilia sp. Dwa41.01b]|uniref:ATP-binding protein n=1 Tax=Massilia sp. Dwa41.01b TaxID=2709302 RepID=UPI001E4ACF61|nr:ATP-binding protein [Massilia sp. Dwa41.01b]